MEPEAKTGLPSLYLRLLREGEAEELSLRVDQKTGNIFVSLEKVD
jgi:hypothetical protein